MAESEFPLAHDLQPVSTRNCLVLHEANASVHSDGLSCRARHCQYDHGKRYMDLRGSVDAAAVGQPVDVGVQENTVLRLILVLC